jgi:glycosyltransferase involved in cell wall biosynthesis
LSINEKSKISIGLPVYNGDKFIRNALDSILSQTFGDFELIISDNASTDSTSVICQEYMKKDPRIRYIRQENNMGGLWNLNFVLQEASYEYFMWAAVDDYWLSTFIEKNIMVLESDKTIVGSISDVELYGEFTDTSKPNINEPSNKNVMKYQYVYPTTGSIEKRVKICLKKFQASVIYGIYRTEILKKSFKVGNFWANDLAMVLNTLKYGNLNIIDEILMYRFVPKQSTSCIQYQLKNKTPWIKIIFLEFPFTVWFLKNFGWKMFMKNIHIFVKLNLRGEYVIISETIRIMKRVIFRQNMFW